MDPRPSRLTDRPTMPLGGVRRCQCGDANMVHDGHIGRCLKVACVTGCSRFVEATIDVVEVPRETLERLMSAFSQHVMQSRLQTDHRDP